MTVYYPDCSNNQWHNTVEATTFVAALPGEGFGAVCHKVTQGSTYADPYWKPVLAQAQQSGLIAIGYHYITTDDPVAQAANYVAHCVDRGVPCMLDFEDGSGNLDNFWAVWRAFAAAGTNVRLSYIPRWYWGNVGLPDLSGVTGLVSSSYGPGYDYAEALYQADSGDTGPGWAPYGGTTPLVWQFTDSALIAGKNVDCNAYRGDITQLRAVLGITTPTIGGTVTAPAAPADPATDADQQLRGPDYTGWPQLGGRSLVDAVAAIGTHLNIPGFTDTQEHTA